MGDTDSEFVRRQDVPRSRHDWMTRLFAKVWQKRIESETKGQHSYSYIHVVHANTSAQSVADKNIFFPANYLHVNNECVPCVEAFNGSKSRRQLEHSHAAQTRRGVMHFYYITS